MEFVRLFDEQLLDLSWSLWTELGVAGPKRRHRHCLILLEELVILTSVLARQDPRLRDESLDWCARFHRFISVSRLKSLLPDLGEDAQEAFSEYAATLNSIAKTNWPVLHRASPLQVTLSGKSRLSHLDSPALLHVRARALLGTGARADLITLFLTESKTHFSVSDTLEMGYSKRNLADILEELSISGVYEKSRLRNQSQYCLAKREFLSGLLGPVPERAPCWRCLIRVLLTCRETLIRNQHLSPTTQGVELRNAIMDLAAPLNRLRVAPPALQESLAAYQEAVTHWLLDLATDLQQIL